MTQQTTAVVKNTANGTQLATKPTGIDVLKNMLNADSVQAQFRNALGKNSGTFVASIIDLYNSDSKLQKCAPKQVVMEALKAAVLHLPINKALGYAYIIPFDNSKKRTDENGRTVWDKVTEPVFQMGYKGYIQLAMRTGQYRTINADVVYEGELRKVSKLTGEIAFDGEKKSDKVIGYFCHFELLNGFTKTLYMTVEQMAIHAKRYSKGIKREVDMAKLMELAQLPAAPDSNTVGWMGNFHGMAIKTVIRNLLSKYGYLSIEMQTAIENDYEETSTDSNVEEPEQTIVLDSDSIDYEDATQEQEAGTADVDPGF